MTILLDKLKDLTLDVAWQVGFEDSNIEFSDSAQQTIADCRQGFERLLDSGNAGFVYGSTAAPGARAKVDLSQERQEELAQSQNLWAPNTFGGGHNWIPEQAVRLIILARAGGYIEGHGRVRLETAQWLANLLSRPIPKMPLDSATGPGEVMPLSWLYPNLEEIDLVAGEIMSLYNGSPCATGLVSHSCLVSERRFQLALMIFALAIEVAAAPLDAYDPELVNITADPFHKNILQQLNRYLADVPQSDRLSHQAPVSWRVIPTVMATAARAIQSAKETAEQSLQSIAHNPTYLPPNAEYPDGRAVSPGGFHNHQASRAIDQLNIADADLCALATKLTSRLLDGTPFGFPKLLVPEGSYIVGTEFLAWSQTSYAERARQAAVPAVLSIGLEDPGGGQSDVAAPVFLAYERYQDVSEAFEASLATLTVTIIQAYRISGRLPPPNLKSFHALLDEAVAPIELGTIGQLGDSLRNLKSAFADGVIGKGELAPLI